MGAWSEVKLPDTGQVVSTTTTFGEDSDYISHHAEDTGLFGKGRY